MNQGRLRIIVILTTLVSASAGFAQEMPGSADEIRDTWGSILYCKAIYQEPQLKGRIYPGDTQACDKADALMRWSIVQGYSLPDQETLENNALQKARVIRLNTRDVQGAVQACREQCRSYASIYDEKSSSGEISIGTEATAQ